jgi:outer membrane protein assembly factor BamB
VDDDRRAYLGTTARGFECRRLDDRGERCWRWKLGADVVTPAALFPDRVVFASYENVLYGLKRSSGDLLWRAPLPSRPLSAPLVSGSAVIVACQERDLVAFDVRSGERLGGVRTPSELRTAPILVGAQLVAGLRNPWAVVALATAAPEPAATEPGLP